MTDTTITEPIILTASTYFWCPSGTAAGRRSNESRHSGAVAEWFENLGLTVEHASGYVHGAGNGLDAKFTYNESCSRVYRRLTVLRNGKRSNITALRALAAASG